MNFSMIDRKLAFKIFEALNTPRALTCKILIDHEEWDQLVNLKADPALYLDADLFFRDYQATELLRKCEGLPTSIDTEAVAIQGFHTAETQCFQTNQRLSRFVHNGPFEAEDIPLANFFDRVKKRIAGILGPLPETLDGKFGKGATFNNLSQHSTVCDKMQHQPTSTPGARDFQYYWKDTIWYRSLALESPNCTSPSLVRGNRFTTVPKDATKDRAIAVEPSINGFYQLSLGRHIRGRLKRIGIDLENGQITHARVARESSSKGDFSTIDLSSASDTVSHAIVKLLLPEAWYQALSALRSPFTRLDDKWYRLEKFSSMGNGYTFELETLIFFALCAETMDSIGVTPIAGYNIFTYGDDIICPTNSSRAILSVLVYSGFTPNKRKTFTEGPFRESCGGDYFLGESVVPLRIKKLPRTPAEWISISNVFRRFVIDRYGIFVPWARTLWFAFLEHIPVNIRRLRGPDYLGDIVIHDEPERWSVITRDQMRICRCYVPISRPVPLNRWSPGVQLAAALYGIPSTGPTRRGSVTGYRIDKVYIDGVAGL